MPGRADNVVGAAFCQGLSGRPRPLHGAKGGGRLAPDKERSETGWDINMDVILGPLARLIVAVVNLYIWILIIGVILSWLTAYNVVNTSNRLVYMVGDFIFRITEPALRPIRNLLPNLGGFDLSAVVLIFILVFAKDFLIQLLFKFG